MIFFNYYRSCKTAPAPCLGVPPGMMKTDLTETIRRLQLEANRFYGFIV